MKRYDVVIRPVAESELRQAFEFIHTDSPKYAAEWLQGLYDAIDSLETYPARCGLAREREDVDVDIRQYIYQSHRIIFTIEKQKVFVHHIRHASMVTLVEPSPKPKRKRRRN